MAVLFECSTDNIGVHLKNIFNSDELDKGATTEKISVVQTEGEREVNRVTTFYNLDAIISVGYRVNSVRATQFRLFYGPHYSRNILHFVHNFLYLIICSRV